MNLVKKIIISFFDQYNEQLEEFIKSLNPKKWSNILIDIYKKCLILKDRNYLRVGL
jgi:hypothetical protein